MRDRTAIRPAGRASRRVPTPTATGHIDRDCPVSPPGGFPADDCDDRDNRRFPGNTESCDAELDEDCDPLTFAGSEGDRDHDGFVSTSCCNFTEGELLCGSDCNDDDPDIRLDAEDGPTVACDGRDNDCDLETDEGCACEDGSEMSCGGGMVNGGVSRCERGIQRCVDGAVGSCEGSIGPADSEICDGRIDDDCDGEVDEGCECEVGTMRPCGGGPVIGGASACREGEQRCTAVGTWSECEGSVSPTEELCSDAVDQNCDGTLNDGCEIVQVSAGFVHTCALRANGHALCWGSNHFGQLGDATNEDRFTPVPVIGVPRLASIATGGNSTCGVATDGTAWCWGRNEEGQLGDGTTTNRNTPTHLPGLTAVTQISTSGVNTCAIVEGGRLYCWGLNSHGSVGDGTTEQRLTPVMVGVDYALRVSAGASHTCAVNQVPLGATYAYCWGANGSGQVGDGTTTQRTLPTYSAAVTPGFLTLEAIGLVSAGINHSCLVDLRDDYPMCWGANAEGQLGLGTMTPMETQPELLDTLTGTVDIVASNHFSCALSSAGEVRCWGRNEEGQLGDGTRIPRASPATVMGVSDAIRLTVGTWHSCVLSRRGTVHCWGWNSVGQIGDGTTSTRELPVVVPSLP